MKGITKTDTRYTQPTEHDRYLIPNVDIFTTKEGWVLMADMPGVNKEGVEVLLEGSELTIIGHKQPPAEGTYLFRESCPGTYRRTFVLDPSIDTSKIRAQVEQGVLQIYLPKVESHKPKRIEIS